MTIITSGNICLSNTVKLKVFVKYCSVGFLKHAYNSGGDKEHPCFIKFTKQGKHHTTIYIWACIVTFIIRACHKFLVQTVLY